MLGLSLHFLHQPRALDDVTEAGIIFDIGRDGKLHAGLQSLHDDGRQPGARAIDGGGKPGRAGARSEEHTSELQSLMSISYADFSLKNNTAQKNKNFTASPI